MRKKDNILANTDNLHGFFDTVKQFDRYEKNRQPARLLLIGDGRAFCLLICSGSTVFNIQLSDAEIFNRSQIEHRAWIIL